MLALFKNKIFCISYQRTGTTSTGQFFKDYGYKVAGYGSTLKNKWTESWAQGNYEKIFKSFNFLRHQVYEDDPWWCTDFYKVLFHRFPKAKFILLERDPDKWFNSMVSLCNGKTIGNTYIHAIIYDRLDEFNSLNINSNKLFSSEIDNLLPLNEEHRAHYKEIYLKRNKEVKNYFESHSTNRLFIGKLEDQMVWKKMGNFFNIKVDENYSSHTNASKK